MEGQSLVECSWLLHVVEFIHVFAFPFWEGGSPLGFPLPQWLPFVNCFHSKQLQGTTSEGFYFFNEGNREASVAFFAAKPSRTDDRPPGALRIPS